MRRIVVCSIIFCSFSYAHVSVAALEKPAEVIKHSRLSSPGVKATVRGFIQPKHQLTKAPSPAAHHQPRTAVSVATYSSSSSSAPEFPSGMATNPCSSAGGVVRFSVVGGVDCHARVTPTRDRPDNERRRRRRAPRVSPEQLASIAYDRARSLAPEARLEVTPDTVGLTGLPSYFHLDSPPQPIAATASAGGVTVTAAARPVQYVWDFGDGKNKVTTHSGRAWSRKKPGNVDHLYERVGRYELAVEVIWQAQWRVNGGPWQPLGYFSTSDSRSYPIRQVRSALVRQR